MSESIPNQTVTYVDKKAIKRLVAETNRRVGFIKDPTATPQKAREMMRAFVDAVRKGGPAPIPFDEIAEVMNATFDAAGIND